MFYRDEQKQVAEHLLYAACGRRPTLSSRASKAANRPGPQAWRSLVCAAMYAAHVLPAARDYGTLYRSFRWQVPAHYNIGFDVCDRWAENEGSRAAILDVLADGAVEEI